MIRRLARWGLALLCLGAGPGAGAAVHLVAPGGPLPTLSAALLAATDGDTVRLTAGEYSEGRLYVWQNHLTIEGATDPPRLSRTALVVKASHFHLRNLTLDGQRAPELANLLHFLFATDALVEDCTIKNPPSGEGSGELGDLFHQAPLSQYSASSGCVRIAAGQRMILRRCNFACDRDDATINQVNVLSYPIGAPCRDLLLQDCTFAAQTRNVILIDSHENITIRDCDFQRTASGTDDRLGLGAISACAVCCIATTPEQPSHFSNVIVTGNRFRGVSGVSILFYNGTADDSQILGNTFEDCFGPNLLVKCQGDAMRVSGNTFRQVASPDSVGAVVETGTREAAPEGAMLAALAIVDNGFIAAHTDGILARDGDLRLRVEDNDFLALPGGALRAEGSRPQVGFVDNRIQGGGTLPGTPGAVCLSGRGQVVADNLFLDHVGAVQFTRDGDFGGRCIVSGNVIAHMRAYGIREAQDAFPGNRYRNNTLALIAGPAVEARSDRVDVYNNIFADNQTGLAVYGGMLGVLDFNLFFQNGPGGTAHHAGLATVGAHDRFADPRFVDAAGGDFRLQPASPARNAGTAPTGPLLDPDYVTDMGAWQDFAINTVVQPGNWERYR